MSKVLLQNSILSGKINVPPSKSAAHRALICSFLSGGGSVSGLIDSKDMKATCQVIDALKNNDRTLDCIESGSTLRFMIPVVAALGISATFVGSGRLPQRPIGDYLRLLQEHNVKCESAGGLPLAISGKLTGGIFEIAGDVSSQYITGLLLALPILDEDSKIVLTTPLQSKPYVDMTIKVMADYGVKVEETEYGYFVKGNQKYISCDYTVEGDWSQAAFFLVGGAISGCVKLTGLDLNSKQGDKEIVSVLKKFGADIEICDDYIICKKSNLKGIEVDATNIPDMVPAIAIAGAYAEGKTVITGAQRLRFKESDRIESVANNLIKMGVEVNQTDDGMIIIPNGNVNGAELDGYNDHRIVMAFSVAALNSKGQTSITDAMSIEKSYPSFFDDYNMIGGRANVICDR